MEAQSNRPDGPVDGATTVASGDSFVITVQIDPAYEALVDAERLHRLACFVLEQEGRRDALEVGISVTSDTEIQALNRQYLAHDYATDVLSFGAEGSGAGRQRESAAAGEADAEEAVVSVSEFVAEGYEGDEWPDGAGSSADGGRGAGAAGPGGRQTEEPASGEAGAEEAVVPVSEFVAEGYEGDEVPDGACLPADAPGTEEATAGAEEGGGKASGGAAAFVTPPGWPTYVGDVVISYETAAAQAADYAHSPAAEVDVLLVHGLLHLLGYDDGTPADRARMHARQDALVSAFS